MWEFKECRETIKKFLWSHGKAQQGERAFKQNTLRNPRNGDTIADLDPGEVEAARAERDERRFVSLADTTAEEGESGNFKDPPPPAYELKDFGYQDVPSDEADENDTLIRRSQRQKNKTSKSSRARRQSRDTEETQFMNGGY